MGLGQMRCWPGQAPNGGCWVQRRVVLGAGPGQGAAPGAEAAGGTPQTLRAHLTAPGLVAHSGGLPAAWLWGPPAQRGGCPGVTPSRRGGGLSGLRGLTPLPVRPSPARLEPDSRAVAGCGVADQIPIH